MKKVKHDINNGTEGVIIKYTQFSASLSIQYMTGEADNISMTQFVLLTRKQLQLIYIYWVNLFNIQIHELAGWWSF